jgi:hypothetical protein
MKALQRYFYLFSSALLTSLNFPFICVLSCFFFRLLGLPFASLIRMTSSPLCSGLATVYCIIIIIIISTYLYFTFISSQEQRRFVLMKLLLLLLLFACT